MPIDYARMAKVHPKQKSALTRAINSKDPEKIVAVCKAAVKEWEEIGSWPDDWNRWQIALCDSRPYNVPYLALESLV